MSSLIPLLRPSKEDEQRVLLGGVPWSTYVVLADSIDSRAVHLTYLEGQLEIMTKSSRHEVSTKQIARLVELFCVERAIPLYGYRETTLRDESKGVGLEPDECYRRGQDGWPPHVALEVIVSNPLLDKLEVYRILEIQEVWVFLHKEKTFSILALHHGQYERVDRSEVIPELDFSRIAHYVMQPDQHEAIMAFRDELRGTP